MDGRPGVADTFEFGLGQSGNIYDFDPSEDIVDITGLGHQITWEELQSRIKISHYVGARESSWVDIDLSDFGGGQVSVRWLSGHLSLEDVKSWIRFDSPMVGSGGHDNLYGGDGHDEIHGGAGVDDIKGYAGNDTLYGGADNDLIGGGAGDDRIIGGTGNDQLHGGTGDDVFVYASGDGDDAIWDFRPSRGDNKIDLTGVTGVSQYSDLNVTQRPGAVVITFPGQEGSITLQNFKIDDLGESDFIFGAAADADGM
ncbi:MAG: hypothetical protein OXH69_12750 [Acidobacteria bacterium]|nr:hypothetical protein [Acidobacteriota bacterium]